MKRNNRGQFIQDRTLYALFFFLVFTGFLIALAILHFQQGMQGMNKLAELTIINPVAQAREVPDGKEESVRDQVKRLAKKYGNKYGVSPYQIIRTVECESKFRNIQSQVRKHGKQENSWGVAQIHLDSHPEVEVYQALDVEFSIEWTAKHFNDVVWYAYNKRTDKCN